MSLSESSLQCRRCGYVFLDESLDTPPEARKSCPECGSIGRATGVTHTEPIRSVDSTKLKARRGALGKTKPYLESRSGKEVYRRTGRIHRVEQIVDRENDRYYKYVEAPETGQIIKHQENL